jgi:hypothetical protein
MNPNLLDAFNDSLDRLARGESLNSCLLAHPQFADDLRLLLTLSQLSTSAAALPDDDVAAAQARIYPRVDDAINNPPTTPGGPLRWIIPLLIALLVLLMLALFLLRPQAVSVPPTTTPTAASIGATLTPSQTPTLTLTIAPSQTPTSALTGTSSQTPTVRASATFTAPPPVVNPTQPPSPPQEPPPAGGDDDDDDGDGDGGDD